MTHASSGKELDTILEELAMEERCDGVILSEYIERYPEYIQEISEFVHELTRPSVSEHLSLSDSDQAQLESQFTKFLQDLNASSRSILGDLSVEAVKDLASKLNVKRQVLTSLRRGLVLVDTISESFMSSLAEALSCDSKELKKELGLPPKAVEGISHKSDIKPQSAEPISFEQTLKNAGYSEDERVQFMD